MSNASRLIDTGDTLDRFFAPRSIAIIGASPDATKIRGLLQSMLCKNGYSGHLYPVNPSYTEIAGVPCFPSVRAVGSPIDLALIAIPATGVLEALEDCVAASVRHAVIISSGFAEEGGAMAARQGAIAALARRTGLRVCGPNAEGFYNEPGRVAATFSPAVEVKSGATQYVVSPRRVGIIAQSGGIGFALYNRGRAFGLRFSYVVSTGNEADLTAGDFFDYMVQDRDTDIILLFLEGVRDAQTFLKAAGLAARLGKPVIVAKIGQSSAGERAALSHTASMTGWNAAYTAVFARYGFIEVRGPDEAVAVTAALATAPLPKGERVAIVTGSGGSGAWAADVIAANGLSVPELSAALQEQIRGLIPSYGSPRNPVDVTAQAVHTGGLQKTIDLLNDSDEVDLIVLVASLSNERRIAFDLEAMRRVAASRRKPVLIYTYTLPSDYSRARIAEAGLAVFPSLTDLGTAARHLTHRARYTPPSAEPYRLDVPDTVRDRLRAAGASFSEYDTKRLLAAAGLPIGNESLVTSAAELDAAMQSSFFPIALKLQSPDLPHKTEVGGVKLAIADAESGRAAYRSMLDDVRTKRAGARIQGVLVSPMAAPGVEIIIGTLRDSLFGPIVMVGLGGITTELFRDIVYRSAPVSETEAAAMIAGLKAAPLLHGFRGAAPADVPALCRLIAQLSAFAVELADEVTDIELNPVVVHPAGQGVTIVDALLFRGDRERARSTERDWHPRDAVTFEEIA